jgi:2-keto-4-pentenoate hydratase/2-oxohepta-3-ene-1,7-dioic acid hydratase in catechol pathway
MRYCRFLWEGRTEYGRVEMRGQEPWIAERIEAPAEDLTYRLQTAAATKVFASMPLTAAQLLAPATPSKIVCIGRNYRDHVKEMEHDLPKEPLIFLKPPSALLAPGAAIVRPTLSQRVDYEGELAVVIGKRARRIRAEDWRAYVRGYTAANDVTARDLQASDGQWSRAKGFDTFCPAGPMISDEIDAANARIETRVNGELRQSGTTADLIFPIPVLLEYISAAMTLEPGDLVLTGTPAGVGRLECGDRVEVCIEGLGALANPVQ